MSAAEARDYGLIDEVLIRKGRRTKERCLRTHALSSRLPRPPQPHQAEREAATKINPTLAKPNMTTASGEALPRRPPQPLGPGGAPKTAANVVTAELPNVAQSASRKAVALGRSASLNSCQAAPSTNRKRLFIIPSRCAASPIRGLVSSVQRSL